MINQMPQTLYTKLIKEKVYFQRNIRIQQQQQSD
ncbi:hypothetical protein V6Z12_A04G122000 [Gossypium hirsutum]